MPLSVVNSAACYTGRMQLNLVPHPATPPSDPAFKVWANVEHAGALGVIATTNIWFGIGAPASRFVMPEAEASRRAPRFVGDDLLRGLSSSAEGEEAIASGISLRRAIGRPMISPRYRDGRTEPTSRAALHPDRGQYDLVGPRRDHRGRCRRPWELGLSAILEEKDGTKSYWALAHPEGDKPDFHDPACFAAHLP